MVSPSKRAAGVVASITLLAACAGSDAPEAVPTTGVARSIHGDGFDLALPPTWAVYDLDATGVVRPLDAAAPPLPADLDAMAIAAALQGGDLYGVAPADDEGRRMTVLVTRVGGDDMAPHADVSEALRQRLADEGISDVRVEIVDAGGHRAARATFRHVGETGLEQQAVTVYVPQPQSSFVLAISRPVPGSQDGTALIDGIVGSFRIA